MLNYQKIYDQFIADRRINQPSETEYVEVHHILPRHVGGSDEPENLIRLRPEDHFFAHLLLAKIHGGRLWVPVVLWCGGDKGNWRAKKSRNNYGWLVRLAGARTAGKVAASYSDKLHRVVNEGGVVVEATQLDLHKICGGTKSGLCLMLNGKTKSHYSWRLESTGEASYGKLKGTAHPAYDGKEYDFVHVDGRSYTGTRLEFRKIYGLSPSNVCCLVDGSRTISKGWMLAGSTPHKIGRGVSYLLKYANDNQPQLALSA